MLVTGYKINEINEEKIEALSKEKYLQISDHFFKNLSNSDYATLDKKLQELNFKRVEDIEHYKRFSKEIYSKDNPFGFIKILKHEDRRYLLNMRYLDDEILLADITQEESFNQQFFLNLLIASDVLILIVIYLIVFRMTLPIKAISKKLIRFSDGEYSIRLKQKSTNDEIGVLSQTFNQMAQKIENLIKSRERLLRDIGHELRTPIAKGKMASGMLEKSHYKEIIQKAFDSLDELTKELLSLEKLKSGSDFLSISRFGAEALILGALSKLYIEDESILDIKIIDDFVIEADKNYLAIAIKNLIDNAVKYSAKLPVFIEAKNNTVSVKNYGERLTKNFEYYLEVFTQDSTSRNSNGFGIGLNIVDTILKKHGFKLKYDYEDGMNVFLVEFTSPLLSPLKH
ncbi:MAG: two-component system, OmpR family, sensor kinase [Campylobacterota bacterium]|nr:two-component system, OmpR family, sensor kinase [Campylobacterota bacterium]